MKKLWLDYVHGEDGATAIEYGLIISAVSITIMATVLVIGDWGEDTFETISSYLQ